MKRLWRSITGNEMRKETSYRIFDSGMLVTILALAWPTMLEQLMQTAVQYIDTAMVGSLGTQATAAVGSTGTINWLIGSTISAVGVGFLSYIAKAYGAKEEEAAKRAVAQAVLITCALGVFFTMLTVSLSGVIPVWMQVDPGIRKMASTYFLILYLPMLPRTASIIFGTVLRSAGDTRSPMKIGLLVNLINVALNFLLIYPTRRVRLFSLNLTVYGAWGERGGCCQRHRIHSGRPVHCRCSLEASHGFSPGTEVCPGQGDPWTLYEGGLP